MPHHLRQRTRLPLPAPGIVQVTRHISDDPGSECIIAFCRGSREPEGSIRETCGVERGPDRARDANLAVFLDIWTQFSRHDDAADRPSSYAGTGLGRRPSISRGIFLINSLGPVVAPQEDWTTFSVVVVQRLNQNVGSWQPSGTRSAGRRWSELCQTATFVAVHKIVPGKSRGALNVRQMLPGIAGKSRPSRREFLSPGWMRRGCSSVHPCRSARSCNPRAARCDSP